MKGRMRPYLPELTIRDYNTYMRYLRGVRRQMYKSYGFYACHLLRTNGVLFAILSDSLAGRMPTCKRQRVPGTLFRRSMMCQTLGIRQAAQTEILMGWHNLQDRKYSELRPVKRLRRAADKLLLRRVVGIHRAERLLVSGELVPEEKALAIGLVDELVTPSDVVPRAVEWLQQLLALPHHPMLQTRAIARADLVAALHADNIQMERFIEGWYSDDAQQALHALVGKLGK